MNGTRRKMKMDVFVYFEPNEAGGKRLPRWCG